MVRITIVLSYENKHYFIHSFIHFYPSFTDAFILTGSFDRTDKSLSTEERIRLAVLDCGASITATTLTTTAAFWLGMTSTIPAIRAFYMYGGPCVLIDFLYQLTFFVALISINERRIYDCRRDCCICFKQPLLNQHDIHQEEPFSRIVMRKYGRYLSDSKILQVMVITSKFGPHDGTNDFLQLNFILLHHRSLFRINCIFGSQFYKTKG